MIRLQAFRELGIGRVVGLGSLAYSPRFGSGPASRYAVTPDDAGTDPEFGSLEE